MPVPTRPTFNRERNIRYWLRCLRTLLPMGYTSNDLNRTSLAFFCVNSLHILGELGKLTTDAERAAWTTWLYGCQHPRGGFRGSPGTDLGAALSDANAIWDPATLPGTFFSLITLLALGDDLTRVNRLETLRWLPTLQRDDGSFAEMHTARDGESEATAVRDPRFSYLAAAVRWMLRGEEGSLEVEVPDVDVDMAVRFLQSIEAYDGGFGGRPGSESHAGHTFCVIAALALFDRLYPPQSPSSPPTLHGLPHPSETVRWLVSRQQPLTPKPTTSSSSTSPAPEYDTKTHLSPLPPPFPPPDDHNGFNGRANKRTDTCYSFWVIASLDLLRQSHLIDAESNRAFLLEETAHVIGGFGKWAGAPPDVLHSCLGIVSLAMMREEGMNRCDSALCAPLQTRERLENLAWRKRRDPTTGYPCFSRPRARRLSSRVSRHSSCSSPATSPSLSRLSTSTTSSSSMFSIITTSLAFANSSRNPYRPSRTTTPTTPRTSRSSRIAPSSLIFPASPHSRLVSKLAIDAAVDDMSLSQPPGVSIRLSGNTSAWNSAENRIHAVGLVVVRCRRGRCGCVFEVIDAGEGLRQQRPQPRADNLVEEHLHRVIVQTARARRETRHERVQRRPHAVRLTREGELRVQIRRLAGIRLRKRRCPPTPPAAAGTVIRRLEEAVDDARDIVNGDVKVVRQHAEGDDLVVRRRGVDAHGLRVAVVLHAALHHADKVAFEDAFHGRGHLADERQALRRERAGEHVADKRVMYGVAVFLSGLDGCRCRSGGSSSSWKAFSTLRRKKKVVMTSNGVASLPSTRVARMDLAITGGMRRAGGGEVEEPLAWRGDFGGGGGGMHLRAMKREYSDQRESMTPSSERWPSTSFTSTLSSSLVRVPLRAPGRGEPLRCVPDAPAGPERKDWTRKENAYDLISESWPTIINFSPNIISLHQWIYLVDNLDHPPDAVVLLHQRRVPLHDAGHVLEQRAERAGIEQRAVVLASPHRSHALRDAPAHVAAVDLQPGVRAPYQREQLEVAGDLLAVAGFGRAVELAQEQTAEALGCVRERLGRRLGFLGRGHHFFRELGVEDLVGHGGRAVEVLRGGFPVLRSAHAAGDAEDAGLELDDVLDEAEGRADVGLLDVELADGGGDAGGRAGGPSEHAGGEAAGSDDLRAEAGADEVEAGELAGELILGREEVVEARGELGLLRGQGGEAAVDVIDGGGGVDGGEGSGELGLVLELVGDLLPWRVVVVIVGVGRIAIALVR
ncbi:hypothetical protein Dda_3364 [Drechslerella dactyloides]|uniref:Prenyltransferase alpha-alpha toroid domain-containing protein n=1 Tax=Drechslerella dactyloides TaxID=74499 RepID=A0AAD6NMS1_DREDA|nr:hypothetical protein Dda_3364 [Drechslerella dactyloides]